MTPAGARCLPRLVVCVVAAVGALHPGLRGDALQAQVADEATVRLTVASGADQIWYVSRQLRTPVVIEVEGVDAARCAEQVVRFASGGDGEVSPHLARPQWTAGRCRAEGWWRLGETVGVQHLSAAAEDGGDPVVVQAIARQGARIFFGGAWTPSEDRWTELVTVGDGAPYLTAHAGESVFRPVIGVDFPLWPTFRFVRMGVGASAREIDRHFYFGFSLLQSLVFGPGQEGSAVDVHAGIQLSRRDIGHQGAVCGPAAFCTRRELRFSGLVLLVTIDGASAFRGLAGSVLR